MAVTTTNPDVVPRAIEIRGAKLHELQSMVEAARLLGVKRLRIGDWEVELPLEAPAAAAEPAEVATSEQVKELEKALLGEMPSADDLLFWSAGGPLPSEASRG